MRPAVVDGTSDAAADGEAAVDGEAAAAVAAGSASAFAVEFAVAAVVVVVVVVVAAVVAAAAAAAVGDGDVGGCVGFEAAVADFADAVAAAVAGRWEPALPLAEEPAVLAWKDTTGQRPDPLPLFPAAVGRRETEKRAECSSPPLPSFLFLFHGPRHQKEGTPLTLTKEGELKGDLRHPRRKFHTPRE